MTRFATLVLIVLVAFASPASAQRHPYPLTEAERSAIDRGLRTGDIAGYKTRYGRDYRLGEFNARDLAVVYRGEDRLWDALRDLEARKADKDHAHAAPPPSPTPPSGPATVAPPGSTIVPPGSTIVPPGAVYVPPTGGFVYPTPSVGVAPPATAAPASTPPATVREVEKTPLGLLGALGLLLLLTMAAIAWSHRGNSQEIRRVDNEQRTTASAVNDAHDGLVALRNQVRHATDGLPAAHTRLDTLETDLGTVQGDLSTLADAVTGPTGVNARLADLNGFVRGTAGTPGLADRIGDLETEIQTARAAEPDLATRINNLDASVLRTDVDSLRADVDAVTEDLGILTDWSAGMDGLVDTNQGDIEAILSGVLLKLDRKDRQLAAVGTAAGVDVDAIT